MTIEASSVAKGEVSLRDKVRERFEHDTADHRMWVLHDTGLYRHLRFSAPGSWTYGFDLVSWPGFLAVTGDMGEYVFSRSPDMFEFFEHDEGINADYWSEKMQGGAGGEAGRATARRFSIDKLRQVALEWWDEEARVLGGEATMRLRDELLEHIARHDPITIESAIGCLDQFEFEDGPDTLRIDEPYFYDFTDWDDRFLWICWAIVYGIAHYRVGPMPVVAWTGERHL